MTDPTQHLVQAYSSDIIEAGLVQSILRSEGIAAYLKDEIMGTLMPWYSAPGGAGSVKVMVAETDFERARQILAEFESSRQKDQGSDSESA
jgi:hypothetical protein